MASNLSDLAVDKKVYSNDGNSSVLQAVPSNARRVLDIGCGAGDNAKALSLRGITVDAITLSESERLASQAYCDRIWIHNLESGLPSEAVASRYDAILCSHVLEHVCFPTSLLNDVRRCLQADGRLIVALPNLMWWKTRLALTMGHFDYADAGIMDNTHFRWYTFRSAQRLLAEHGFRVEVAKVLGNLPIGPLRRWLPSRFVGTLDRTVSRMLPGLVGYEMIFAATHNSAFAPEHVKSEGGS